MLFYKNIYAHIGQKIIRFVITVIQ